MLARRAPLAVLVFLMVLVVATACDTPPQTFAQQRTVVVQYLRDLNKPSNNLTDTMEANSSDLASAGSSNLLRANAALNTLLAAFDGFQRQLAGLRPSSAVPQLVELHAAKLAEVKATIQLFQNLRTAIQSGRQTAVQAALEQVSLPTVSSTDLQKALLVKYNIPDSEVGFRRSQ